jgi:septal ring-binding cell division protein DamX
MDEDGHEAPAEPAADDAISAAASNPASDAEMHEAALEPVVVPDLDTDPAATEAADPAAMSTDGGEEIDDDDSSSEGPAEAAAGSNDKKLLKALDFKERGNVCVKEQDWAGAKRMYERGIKIVTGIFGEDQAEGG